MLLGKAGKMIEKYDETWWEIMEEQSRDYPSYEEDDTEDDTEDDDNE